MAEIKIQRKKGPVWPWLLGLLIVAGLIWFLIEAFDTPDDDSYVTETEYEDDVLYEDSTEMSEALVSKDTSEISAFSRFVKEENRVTDTLIIKGMDHLSGILGNMVNQTHFNETDIHDKQMEMTKKIDKLKVDSTLRKRPQPIKEAFISAANLMEGIQKKSYPGLDSTMLDIMETAQSIDSTRSIEQQKMNIKNFFEKSSELMTAMADTTNVTVKTF